MSTSNKINIVFILADDLAVWAVGCYGNAEILTPNLDRIATTGVRFENFFVTSSGHNWDPAVRFVEEVVGPDRLLFAADYPMEDCKQQVEQANDITLAAPDKFFYMNAERVFGLG